MDAPELFHELYANADIEIAAALFARNGRRPQLTVWVLVSNLRQQRERPQPLIQEVLTEERKTRLRGLPPRSAEHDRLCSATAFAATEQVGIGSGSL